MASEGKEGISHIQTPPYSAHYFLELFRGLCVCWDLQIRSCPIGPFHHQIIPWAGTFIVPENILAIGLYGINALNNDPRFEVRCKFLVASVWFPLDIFPKKFTNAFF